MRVFNKKKRKNYEKGKKMFLYTFIVGLLCLGISFFNCSKTDFSRLNKQWNRVYIVERFGIILYQGNDLVQTLRPKISSLFGYDEALQLFTEYYESEDKMVHIPAGDLEQITRKSAEKCGIEIDSVLRQSYLEVSYLFDGRNFATRGETEYDINDLSNVVFITEETYQKECKALNDNVTKTITSRRAEVRIPNSSSAK